MLAATPTLYAKVRAARRLIADMSSDDDAADAMFGQTTGPILAVSQQLARAVMPNPDVESWRTLVQRHLESLREALGESHLARARLLYSEAGRQRRRQTALLRRAKRAEDIWQEVEGDPLGSTTPVAYSQWTGVMRATFLVGYEDIEHEEDRWAAVSAECLLRELDRRWATIWETVLFQGEQQPLETLFAIGMRSVEEANGTDIAAALRRDDEFAVDDRAGLRRVWTRPVKRDWETN